MNLVQIPKSKIKVEYRYLNGFLVIFDERSLPLSFISQPENAVAYFDNSGELIWTASGAKESGFWQKTGDCFTGLFVYDEGPVVTTFSGHIYHIEMGNGELTYSGMSK